MAGSIDSVDQAFASVPNLRKRVYSAIDENPRHEVLFHDISAFILSSSSRNTNGADEPPSKKRRIENGDSQPGAQPASSWSGASKLILEARDISFSLPQRKKLHLGLVEDSNQIYSIQLRNPSTNQVEAKYSLSSYAYALRLPVPEKNQKQYNFCLLPESEVVGGDPIIWTINHGPLKSYKIETDELKAAAPGPENVLEDALNFVLKASEKKLILPNEKEFASALRESHRKNDIAYHVKAFRGSKEGYLFFLENGIFFGFKKPLSFFAFDNIEAISYTSVLQRTFNLNFTVRQTPGTEIPGTEIQEIEYSMIDQQDFAGIDEYLKRHQLQDASLAEARRAKKAGKAGKTAADTNGGAEEDDNRTELEKAQAELEDEEDEMEEDYDPDEEDDGSGSESESGEEEYTKGKGRDLIAEELGSEAEDVSSSEDGGEEDENAQQEEEEEDDAAEELQAVSMPKPMPSHPPKRAPNGPDLDDEDQL